MGGGARNSGTTDGLGDGRRACSGTRRLGARRPGWDWAGLDVETGSAGFSGIGREARRLAHLCLKIKVFNFRFICLVNKIFF